MQNLQSNGDLEGFSGLKKQIPFLLTGTGLVETPVPYCIAQVYCYATDDLCVGCRVRVPRGL